MDQEAFAILENNILRHCIITDNFSRRSTFQVVMLLLIIFPSVQRKLQIVEEVGNRRIKNSSLPTFPALFCATKTTKTEFSSQREFENEILNLYDHFV